MKCRFCSEEATAQCFWAEKKGRRTPAIDVRRGDTILIPVRGGERIATVTGIEDLGDKVAIWAVDQNGAAVMGRFRPLWDHLMVDSFGPCAVPVCELHQQERGPQKVLCQSHWRAWESVA